MKVMKEMGKGDEWRVKGDAAIPSIRFIPVRDFLCWNG